MDASSSTAALAYLADTGLAIDPFLRDLADAGVALDDAFAALAATLAPVVPPRHLRDRVWADAVHAGRFERFVAPIAALADLSGARTRELLDGLATATGWETGPVPARSSTLWVDGGAAARGSIRGFLRVDAGVAFPEHEHLGEEWILVMQGGLVEEDGRHRRPGEITHAGQGTCHGFSVAPGPDLLCFTVVRRGLRIGDALLLHRDDG